MSMKKADVIIIGSGVAALQLCKHLCTDKNVILFTKTSFGDGNSALAQGGIAAAMGDKDHPYFHFVDTVIAGRSLNDHASTLRMTQEAPAIIEELARRGCNFDRSEDNVFALGKEGAHHQNRIVHGGGDQTGKVLINHLKATVPDNIQVFEYHFVFQLLLNENNSCQGVRSKDRQGIIHECYAPDTILATGGCGQVYSFTSNACSVTGDGMALAYQAGATLTDMEFIQFHPTLLYINGQPKGLISEAVRGAGAILIDGRKQPIMDDIHPLKDLAPRHIVSQTIFQKRQASHDVYLDIRMIDDFQDKFPGITNLCVSNGINVAEGLIPVVPGCHFSMGGVETDTLGRTTIQGLYAIGEVACTGVHGANRLASNSLLEGLVYGKRLAQHLNEKEPVLLEEEENKSVQLPAFPFPLPSRKRMQELMMANVGIIRHKDSLLQQLEWLESYHVEQWHTFDMSMLTTEQMTTVFMAQTAWLITKSAFEREESRGGHHRSDFPEEQMTWQNRQIIQQRTFEMGRFHEPVNT
ncbi:L-aspartate oxidase [Halobacillus dabanensis]|uniref:L-aspartate oxidase n=1 Tax=Halobacillus dabanensis TaxID=240302 RepID=A0A1I3ZQ20_HALDA|nr:L-aspartate oxidase [Halobacillus dabanensis]